MAEKVVSVRLQARVEGFTAGMRKAKASVDDLTKADVPKAARGYKDLADKAALAGAAIGVGLGVAVKRFADFDSAMSAVKANSGAAADELEALRQSALQLGADSQFSATEAAQGINELAKAGIATADVLGGGLKGALDLAAAGQISVAEAAETTASAMTQFGLKGDKAVHVADLLASGANKAQGGVGDLGAALNQAGLVAASTGLSIEETAAGLTAFASAGLVGSDAGTSFKAMLQRLSAPSGEAAALMSELGISAYDTNGQFVGLAAVAGQLEQAFVDKTDAERNAAMATIFGSDAVRASNILYNEGADGIARWTDEVNQQGAAARQAATLTDNLSGDIERLGGAFDSVLIDTGSGANASLRTLVQGLQGLVETVGKVPGPVLLLGAGLASMALVVPRGIVAVREYAARLESLGVNFDKAGGSASAAARNFNIAGLALAGAAAATAAFDKAGDSIADKFGSITVGVEAATSKIIDASGATDEFTDVMDRSQGRVAQFGGYLEKVSPVANVFGGDIENASESVANYDKALASLVTSGNGEAAADFLKRSGVNAAEAADVLPVYTEALKGADNAAVLAASSGSKMTTATADLAEEAVSAEDALKALKDAIDGLGSPFAQQRAAGRAFQDAIDAAGEAIEQYGKKGQQTKEQIAEFGKVSLTAAGDLDVSTEAGRGLQASLDDLRATTLEKVAADYEAAGGAANLTQATKAGERAMRDGRSAFLAAAEAAGIAKSDAKKLADQLGLIPGNVAIAVSQSGAAEAGAAIDEAARDRTAVITVQRRYADQKARQENEANEIRRAGGGPIWGAGTKTSDSIPIWASTGEFMQKAAAVDKYGLSFMHAVNSLQFPSHLARGYATGGPIQPQYAPPVQYVMGGPSSHSTTNDSRFIADSVTIVTEDARSFERELRRGTPYRAKARPGR